MFSTAPLDIAGGKVLEIIEGAIAGEAVTGPGPNAFIIMSYIYYFNQIYS